MLNPDYRDILSIFAAEGVEFLLVGAYAMAAYGNPRATGDIDLWVHPSPENSRRVLQAIKSFGAPLQGLEATDFQKPGIVFQIGIVPRRIDILTQISGIEEFEPAWNRREEILLEGITIPVLSRSDFKTNKLAIGRPKDLADIAWIDSLE